MQKISKRFLASQIPKAIWGKFFEGSRMREIIDPAFLGHINGTMIWLTCAIICHALRAWQTGVYKDQATSSLKPPEVSQNPDHSLS